MKPAIVLVAALLSWAWTCQPAAAQERGDATRGAALYQQRCGACHSLDANRVGPMHRGIYGRKAGGVEGFQYSAALRKLQVVWNAETLDRWLTNPPAMAPGTAMGVRVPQGQDRADIIVYLRSSAAR